MVFHWCLYKYCLSLAGRHSVVLNELLHTGQILVSKMGHFGDEKNVLWVFIVKL